MQNFYRKKSKNGKIVSRLQFAFAHKSTWIFPNKFAISIMYFDLYIQSDMLSHGTKRRSRSKADHIRPTKKVHSVKNSLYATRTYCT